MTRSHRPDLLLKGSRSPGTSTPPTSPEICLKSRSQAISCPPLSGTASLILLIVSDASPSIVNVLELPTAAIIDIFVCDGDGGGVQWL